jgi:hypothetical protein
MGAMSSGDTRTLIEQAIRRFGDEVPALRQLSIVLKLELPTHGAGAPVWRVELPAVAISRDPAGDARVAVTVQRPEFNRLAKDGGLRDWVDAYNRGHVSVTGEAAVVKLVGNVIERQLARAGAR